MVDLGKKSKIKDFVKIVQMHEMHNFAENVQMHDSGKKLKIIELKILPKTCKCTIWVKR